MPSWGLTANVAGMFSTVGQFKRLNCVVECALPITALWHRALQRKVTTSKLTSGRCAGFLWQVMEIKGATCAVPYFFPRGRIPESPVSLLSRRVETSYCGPEPRKLGQECKQEVLERKKKQYQSEGILDELSGYHENKSHDWYIINRMTN